MLSIFISHSGDNDWCRCFASELEDRGHDVWFDKSMRAGERWISKIEEEILNREIFMIILTPTAWSSKWVQTEYHLAIQKHKRIVAVEYEQTEAEGFIRTYQWIDVIGQDCADAAQTVAAALEADSESASSWQEEDLSTDDWQPASPSTWIPIPYSMSGLDDSLIESTIQRQQLIDELKAQGADDFIEYKEHLIAVQRGSSIGEEIVWYDGRIISDKIAPFGATHEFSVYEDGEEVEYIVKLGPDPVDLFTRPYLTVRRNGIVIFSDKKRLF